MLNINFFYMGNIKDNIDYLIKHPEIFQIMSDKKMLAVPGFGHMTKYDLGYVYAVVAASKDGPKMLVP